MCAYQSLLDDVSANTLWLALTRASFEKEFVCFPFPMAAHLQASCAFKIYGRRLYRCAESFRRLVPPMKQQRLVEAIGRWTDEFFIHPPGEIHHSATVSGAASIL